MVEEWKNLSMTDRAKYIKTGVESGLTNIEAIKKAYSIYAEGGPMEDGNQEDVSLEESGTPIKVTRPVVLPTKRPLASVKGKYDSYVPEQKVQDTYEERDRTTNYRPYEIPYYKVNEAVKALSEKGATKAQIAAMLGNVLAESGIRDIKQINGPARGYFQLEPGHRQKYEQYLRDNNLEEGLASEAAYAYDYMQNNLNKKTPYESQNSKYWKSSWSKHDVYKGITTEDATRKWNLNNPDSASDAFLNLFELAGHPRDQIRRDYSSQFYFDPNINWEEYFPSVKALGGHLNKFAIGGPQKTELYVDSKQGGYKAVSPEEFFASIVNPNFQHQSDRLEPTVRKTKEDIQREVVEQPILKAQDKSEKTRDYFNSTPYARRLSSEAKKNRWIEETRLGKTYKDIKEPLLFTPLAPIIYGGESIYSISNKDIIGGMTNSALTATIVLPMINRIPESTLGRINDKAHKIKQSVQARTNIPKLENQLASEADDFFKSTIVPKLKDRSAIGEGIAQKLKDRGLYHPNNKRPEINLNLERVLGSHYGSGKNEIAFRGRDYKNEMKATAIHEAASHGTDDLVEMVDPSAMWDYMKLVRGLPMGNPARKWFELRATKNELEYLYKKKGFKLENVGDSRLLHDLNNINGYGRQYFKYSAENPEWVKNFRKSFSLPVTAGTSLKILPLNLKEDKNNNEPSE